MIQKHVSIIDIHKYYYKHSINMCDFFIMYCRCKMVNILNQYNLICSEWYFTIVQ